MYTVHRMGGWGLVDHNNAAAQSQRKEGILIDVPVWEKYTLSVDEAAAYFRIGQNKLRKLIDENIHADYLLWNGNRPQIKRKKFENYVDRLCSI